MVNFQKWFLIKSGLWYNRYIFYFLFNFLYRIFLQREISLLEKSKLISVDPEVPENMKWHFPSKISSTIRAWASVNWEQYVALDVTKHLVESGAVDENDFLFRFVIL